MGEYVYTLICAAVFVAVIIALTPKNNTLSKYVAFAGALIMALVMLGPVASYLVKADIPQREESEPEKQTGTENYRFYAQSAGMALCEIYGTNAEELTARVECKDNGTIESITLLVKGNVTYDTEEAGDILSEIYEKNIRVEQYE